MVYNTIGLRLLAVFADNLLLFPLVFINRNEAGTFTFIAGIVMLLEHTYFIIGHAQYGQTLGKKLLGLKVVRAHQHLPIGWRRAFVRELYWIILSVMYAFFLTDPDVGWAMIPGMVMIIADVSLAMMHPQNRSLRDFMAGTVVIRSINSPSET